MLKVFFIIILAIAAIIPASAQDKRVEHRMVVDIPFHLSGSEEDDIRYDIDSVALKQSLYNIYLLNQDSTAIIKSVEFYSSVSPEGTIRINKRLGKMRLATAERIIRDSLHISPSVVVTRTERYIPWHEYLLPAIKADSTVPYREELIQLIYRPADAKGKDNRLQNLQHAYNGKLYKVVEERYFDYMRKGGAIITVERVLHDDIISNHNIFDKAKGVSTDDLCLEKIEPSPAQPQESETKRSDIAVSVKTNALGWGLTVMNIAAELDFAKHWSLHIPIYYAAHNYFTPTIKFRTLATQPEVRYYLKESNTGFFAGAHFGVASYNIAVDGDKRYQDHDGKCPALGGGISIGYRMPLSKKRENWQIEFVVGAGAYSLHYDTFYNVKNGRLIGTHRKTYWGLDNAAVNISYRFDINKRKR